MSLWIDLLTRYPVPTHHEDGSTPAPMPHGIPAHLLPGGQLCHGCEAPVNRDWAAQ